MSSFDVNTVQDKESLYGAGFITRAQYLAELMCFRKAMRENLTLPDRFWKDKTYASWTKYLQFQVRHASKLLLVYDWRSIIHVLTESPKAYSLSPAFVRDAIDKADSHRGSYGSSPAVLDSHKEIEPVKWSSNTPLKKRKQLDG